MIQKLIIKELGCFGNINDPKLSFKKDNIIFGYNGCGKTTLTAILRSLKKNDGEILLGRKRISGKKDIKIEVKISGETLIFDGLWKKEGRPIISEYKNIFIFDDQYIQENLFAERYDTLHKKAMYKIIFGETGVSLSKKLSELRQEKSGFEKEKKHIIDQLHLQFHTTEQFCNLDKINKEKTVSSIQELEKELQLIKKKSYIQKLLNFIKLEKIPVFDHLELIEFFSQKVSGTSHIEAKKKILKYKEKYWNKEGGIENFLLLGLEGYNEKECPFCHKSVDQEFIDIIDIYKNFFDQFYEEAKQKRLSLLNLFKNWNLELYFSTLESTLKRNMEIYPTRKDINKELPIINIVDVFDSISLNKIISQKTEIEKILSKNNTGDSINLEKSKLRESIEKIKIGISKYNENISLIERKINEFKLDLGHVNKNKLEKEIEKEKEILKRLNNKESNLCIRWNDIANKMEDKSSQILDIQKKINEEQKNIADNYVDTINKKLESLGIDINSQFKVTTDGVEIHSGANSNDARVEIILEMMGQLIPMSSTCHKKPSFQNTLSRGDKNTLAFAFFLSQLEIYSEKKDLILVFDDPLTSHDHNRQDETATKIKEVSSSVKQIFIFSHKIEFVSRLYLKFKDTASYYYLDKFENNTTIKSYINPKSDILKNDYQKLLDQLEYYGKMMTPTISANDLGNKIRRVLEDVLMTKYYKKLKNESSPSLLSYNILKKHFFETGTWEIEIENDLKDLANISNDSSHRSNEGLCPSEMKGKISKMFNLLEKI